MPGHVSGSSVSFQPINEERWKPSGFLLRDVYFLVSAFSSFLFATVRSAGSRQLIIESGSKISNILSPAQGLIVMIVPA